MESKNQYDGNEKSGESWRRNTRIFLTGRIQPLKYLLKWAEDRGSNVISEADVLGLRPFMDEDPVVLNHLVWAYFGVNLTGAAKEIFGNVDDSNGIEVYRRLHTHIFARNEHRRGELYMAIHNPRSVAKAADIPGALEEWETTQRLHREVGGAPLQDETLKELALKILPWEIKRELITKRSDGSSWASMKESIKEHARVLVMYGGPGNAGLHNLLAEKDVSELDEVFWATTDDMAFEDAVEAMGDKANSDTILALVTRRKAPAWKGRKPTSPAQGDGAKKDEREKRPMLCANCGRAAPSGRLQTAQS